MSENTNERLADEGTDGNGRGPAGYQLRAEVERLKKALIPLTDLVQELDLTRQNLHHARAMGDAHFDRAEAAEAERDRARSLAATLEARLAQVEALADTWERGYNSPTASAWAKVHAANLRAALNEDA